MKQAEAKAEDENSREQAKAQAIIVKNVKEAKMASDYKAREADEKAKEQAKKLK